MSGLVPLHRRRRPHALLACVALAFACGGCGRYPQSTFVAVGPVSRMELQLFYLGLWIVGGVFLVVAASLAYVILRFRERPGDRGLPLQYEGDRRLELVWTLGPIVLLAILAVPTVKDTFALARMPAHALQVTVTGHQWWWQFGYPGQDIETADELHIPTGEKIDLAIGSVDVIHSFWVPQLAGKMDAVPGQINHLWLQADRPGIYDGQCAEFCGVSHANMRFIVDAQPPAAFADWLAQMHHPAGIDPTGGLAAVGHSLFQTESCAGCHTIDGTPYQGTIGPNLTGFGRRRLLASMMANTNANLVRWLTDPPAVKPGADMPDLHLSPAQIQALVAFLRGLQ